MKLNARSTESREDDAGALAVLRDTNPDNPGGGRFPGDANELWRAAPGWLKRLVVRHFPADNLYNALWAARALSQFKPDAHSPLWGGRHGVYLLPVSLQPRLARLGSSLFDPAVNVQVAAAIFRAAGSFEPWYNPERMTEILGGLRIERARGGSLRITKRGD